jgi:hypothetical protein
MGLLQIEVPEELERQLNQEAERRGVGVADLACAALRKAVSSERAQLASVEARLAAGGDAVARLFAGLQRRRPEDLIAMARQQGVKPVDRFEDLLGDFWPEDESVDEFLEERRRLQWEGAPGFPHDEPERQPGPGAPRRGVPAGRSHGATH